MTFFIPIPHLSIPYLPGSGVANVAHRCCCPIITGNRHNEFPAFLLLRRRSPFFSLSLLLSSTFFRVMSIFSSAPSFLISPSLSSDRCLPVVLAAADDCRETTSKERDGSRPSPPSAPPRQPFGQWPNPRNGPFDPALPLPPSLPLPAT